MYDWNDLKAFLAVARGGSTLSAAKALGVNQTTVARRIEALEGALSLRLFERGQAGSRLTEAGAELVVQAEAVERAAKGFGDRALARGRGMSGRVKLTCSDLLANVAVTDALGRFRLSHPEVQVEMVITDDPLDIAAGEADVAVRLAAAPLPPSDEIARRLADFEVALYCSRDYAARRGRPSVETLADHDLISCETRLGVLPGAAWMLAQAGHKAPAHISNSVSNLGHAVRAGMGVAPMGLVLGEGDPSLVRCSEPIPEAAVSAWIVMRRETKDTPRIRALIDFLTADLRRFVEAQAARA